MCSVLDLELPSLVVTITNLVFRVFTASLIGVYTFAELFLSLLVTYGVLKVTETREEISSKRSEAQEKIPEETTTSLTIQNEKEQPSEDAEAIQLEPCESSKDRVNSGANGAPQPTADRDVESQEGLQVAEDPERGSEEKRSSDAEETKEPEPGRGNKKKEESFLLTAAVCSTWIPSVVGKQEQKIFLKAGIASLVTKTTFLAIAIGLSSYGYNLHPRPSLVWCLDASSPLIEANSSVIYCDFDDQNSRWPSCKPDASNYTHITDFADSLEKLEVAMVNFEEKAQKIDNNLFQSEIPSIGLQKIRDLRKEVNKFLRRVGLKGLVQKVRICGPEEKQIRNWTFVVLGALAVFAALATYHLHKITSYKVGFQLFCFAFD